MPRFRYSFLARILGFQDPKNPFNDKRVREAFRHTVRLFQPNRFGRAKGCRLRFNLDGLPSGKAAHQTCIPTPKAQVWGVLLPDHATRLAVVSGKFCKSR